MLPKAQKYTYEEFLEITKDVERAEFIDGEIIYQATPTLRHQRILGNLLFEFKQYLKGKSCEPFIAPFDIILKKENEEVKRVQPDLFVLCGDKPLDKNEFNCIPTLVIEILSPSNASDDYIRKLNLYMRFQVSEYWIVSPKSKTITVYSFDIEIEAYSEPIVYSKDDFVSSILYNDLSIELKSIFE